MCYLRFNCKRTIFFLSISLIAFFIGVGFSKIGQVFTRPNVSVEVERKEIIEKIETKSKVQPKQNNPCERIPLPSEEELKEKPESKAKRTISGGVLNHRSCLALPELSKEAIERKVFGKVKVEVLMDENGFVRSAKIISGERLLRKSAVEAAYKSKSGPTLLGGESVKVRGIFIFDFLKNNLITQQTN